MGIPEAAMLVSSKLGRDRGLIPMLRPAYNRFLRIRYGNRGMPWRINGEKFRVAPTCRSRMGPVYDSEVAAFFKQHVCPGQVFFDVGANCGVYVLQFSRWSPGGSVHAFEPNPGALDVLNHHIRINQVPRCTVVPAAVGAERSEMSLFLADPREGAADGRARLGAPNPAFGNGVPSVRVPVITLDDYCAEAKVQPDWLLMDVEGLEFQVLKGASRLLTQHREKVRVVAEMHPYLWTISGVTELHARQLISEFGFELVPLSGQRDPWAEYGLVFLRPK